MPKRATKKVCVEVDTPKRMLVGEVVLCMNSNKEHGGWHITVPIEDLPKDFVIDGILIYHEPKK